MQVTSLFATFFAFLTFVAPLATQALQIITPTNITTSNVTIAFSSDTDPLGLLNLFLVRNTTRDKIAAGIDPAAGAVAVTIPADLTGSGWTIQAFTSDNILVSTSPLFSIVGSPPKATHGMSMAGGIVGGVVAGIVGLSLIVFGVFIYVRRRRQQFAGPEFNLEAGFPPSQQMHERSVSSMSTGLGDSGNNSLELEKMQWEMELEDQFARARAGTPDVARGASPMPRGTSPPRGAPLMPLVPQRATRNTKS